VSSASSAKYMKGAGIAGLAGMGLMIGSGFVEDEGAKENMATAGNVLSMGATGAMIGSTIFPGIGTAIGALLGAGLGFAMSDGEVLINKGGKLIGVKTGSRDALSITAGTPHGPLAEMGMGPSAPVQQAQAAEASTTVPIKVELFGAEVLDTVVKKIGGEMQARAERVRAAGA